MSHLGSSVCSLFREDDLFRRFFAMFSWFLKIFTLIIFFATLRFHDQQLALQPDQEQDNNREGSNYPRRPRRVAYRPLTPPAE